jgi:SPOR domain
MVDKKDDKKEKDPFSDSSEIFESIFKEATQEIQKETGKVVPQPGLRPKPKPEVKPKPPAKPKAPTKLELEPKEEAVPKAEPLQEQPRHEQKPRLQPPTFKPRQEPIRRPITRTSGPDEEETGADLLSTHRLVRRGVQEQKPREEPIGKVKKPKAPKKKGKGSPVLKIILVLVLLAVGVGGASVYFGIIDLSDYLGGSEPAKKEAPKVAATKTAPAQPAIKPPQPAASKAAQPSRPQAKPAESSKAPAQAQTAQPPQASPKPAESVTQPPPPPQPQEAQAKPQPPAPPAVAKAETPPSPVQPPVKVEPPPAPVQPPAKSQPQASPPPVQPPVKSEAKATSAPVQQPAVPKKAETPQTASQPKEVAAPKTVPPVSGSGGSYAYSVYLGSFQTLDYLKRALSVYEHEGFSTYWTKVELGAKGTWYRVFTGYFRSAQEAEAFIQQKRIKDGEVKETRYSNLIGTFGTKQGGEERALALARMGLSAYCIPAADGQVRLYSGAFMTKEGAEKNEAELNSRGVRSEVVER